MANIDIAWHWTAHFEWQVMAGIDSHWLYGQARSPANKQGRPGAMLGSVESWKLFNPPLLEFTFAPCW